MGHPDARPLVALLLALLAPAAAAADAESVTVGGTRDAVSFEAHEAPYSSVRDALGAYGVHVRAGVDDRTPVTLSFAALSPRGAAERVGAALGGLLPLSVSWEDPGIPGLRETEHFLVRGATLARRMLEAACLPGPGAARARLQPRLLALGADLLPELRDYLATTAEERSRALAVGILGRIESPEAVPLLRELLRADPAPLAREAAAVALGAAARREAVPDLRAALADADAGVALAAAWALVRVGDHGGVRLAAARLADEDPALALRAIDVIEATGEERLIPELARGTAASAALVRGRAAVAIASLRTAGLPDEARAAAFAELLADPALEVRTHARGALAELDASAALAAFDKAAGDPASPGRMEAARAAGLLRRRIAAPPVEAIVE